MEIISRARWGARYARGFGPAPLPASEVWLHHSVTLAPDLVWIDADRDGVEDDEERAMRLLEDIGQQRFGGGISYTFAVMPSGRIYDGHGVDRQGAHTANRNSIARAIVLVGDYTSRDMTSAQVHSVAWLLQHGKAAGWWKFARLNGGHRQAPGAMTECPGDRAFATIPTINQLAAGGPIQEEDVKPFQDLILAREAEGKKGTSWPKVFVGNGIVRRHVKTEADLKNLQYRIQLAGGDSKVQEGWTPGSLPGVLGVELKDAS